MRRAHLIRVQRQDRWARRVITVGGMLVIVSVVAILLLIVRETLPLFTRPASRPLAVLPASARAGGAVLTVGMDDYLESIFLITREGAVEFYAMPDGHRLEQAAPKPPDGASTVREVRAGPAHQFTLTWDNGAATLLRVRFRPRFDGAGVRTLSRAVEHLGEFSRPEGASVLSTDARSGEEGSVTAVMLVQGPAFHVQRISTKQDLLGNETIERNAFVIESPLTADVAAYTLSRDGSRLFATTRDGHLVGWSLDGASGARLIDAVATGLGKQPSSLTFLYGDEALAVAGGRTLTVWAQAMAQDGTGKKRLRATRKMTLEAQGPYRLVSSERDRSLLVAGDAGVLLLRHATSERPLMRIDAGAALRSVAWAPRGNGVVAHDDQDRVLAWTVRNPHPEASAKTLFGRVWYENYPEPGYTWQSSSASDDFEPKLSLVPLIFGSIKGTVYAMLFSAPLALFGALYTSQFTTRRIRAWVKPTVEVMAAIPSVVVGFLAALWFAPLVERNLTGFFLSLGFLPAALVVAVLVWQGLRRWKPLRVVEVGYEFAAVVPVLVVAVALAVWAGPLVERAVFGGDVKLWMHEHTGARYDPRNCVIIAFALGFAVIPIIFTIAEDAFSNVPHSLTAASLAVGASRWQTVWRVVLPSASPGLFAGLVIGLGRAVGETMIVLMATGNTPIMDWSAFNGMRTLSANIAVEIPEAPHGGTLYRVLFLSAVVLFAMTFVLNTAAELVRQRLRAKYGRFQ